jgi:hypothetical protein
VRLLLLWGAVATLSGCRFWYKPVPVANAIGEERTVLAKDSVNVHRDNRFEVYGPNSEAVYDGYEQLNRAYRAFERFFGAPAPRLAVVLSADSNVAFDSATMRSFHDRGFAVVRYVRPRSFKSPSRYGAIGYGGVLWPIGPTAARAMLARFADAQLERDGDRPNPVLLERFPAWFRAAVVHLVGEAGSSTIDLEYVRDKRSSLVPFREMLTLVRPSSADSTLDPSRRGDADEFTRMFAAQAATFGRFLVEREGPAVLGRLGRGYVAGRSFNDMIAEFHSASHTLFALEQSWKLWLDAREE